MSNDPLPNVDSRNFAAMMTTLGHLLNQAHPQIGCAGMC